VIFLGDRSPLLLSPWSLDPSLLNVRFVSGAIEYRRTVFQYFEWLLGLKEKQAVSGGEAGPGLTAVGAGPGGGGRRAWRKRAWARNKAGGVARGGDGRGAWRLAAPSLAWLRWAQAINTRNKSE
jgi:hypothetical protein